MALRWFADGGTGAECALRGLDSEGRYVAQLVKYDVPDGWVTYGRQRRVPGVIHPDVEAAKHLAEVGLELLRLRGGLGG